MSVEEIDDLRRHRRFGAVVGAEVMSRIFNSQVENRVGTTGHNPGRFPGHASVVAIARLLARQAARDVGATSIGSTSNPTHFKVGERDDH